MRILNRLLNWVSSQQYSAPHELRAIWDNYSDQWVDNNDRYSFWKPASVLPAPKWAIKRAMKLGFSEWPEPIDWTIYSAFFMEFVDLSRHLPQEKYDAIQSFRKRRIKSHGEEKKMHDSLLMFRLNTSVRATDMQIEQSRYWITNIRDGLRRSAAWDPVDVDDFELDTVRRILIESEVEFATLIEEWRFYILSIGRDQYQGKRI